MNRLPLLSPILPRRGRRALASGVSSLLLLLPPVLPWQHGEGVAWQDGEGVVRQHGEGVVRQGGESVLRRYDLSSEGGRQVPLPRSLQEVSGLATSPDGRLFAHEDERAVIYEIDPGSGRIVKAFGVGRRVLSGDFEGLAIAGERFFLVTSTGQLVEFREGGRDSRVAYEIRPLPLRGQCELEGLAFDPETNALLLPCKTPRAVYLRNHLVVFSYSLESMRLDLVPRVFLPWEKLDEEGLGNSFHPSAIEVHPGTRALVLVAAREEDLLELSPVGEILETERLSREKHPQPEGLAFLPDGSLILSDEGRGGSGRLTRYSPTRPEGGRRP